VHLGLTEGAAVAQTLQIFNFKGSKIGKGLCQVNKTDYKINLVPYANIPVGGRLQKFAENWKSITTDKWVIQTLTKGYLIEFTSHPPSFQGIRETDLPSESFARSALLGEVDDLLQKSAIEVVPRSKSQNGFYSRFFLVPKKSGGLRPILNLRPLNKHVKSSHFKMQTLRSIIQALQPGDWVAKLDLKDAYFHIPIHPKHRMFLRFAIQGKCYQFRALPFGLTSAPRIFTKIMSVVGAYLHKHQIQIFMFLDDWLLKSESQEHAEISMSRILQEILRLGLIPNWEKSSLTPTQDIEYLGTNFKLKEGKVLPTQERFSHLCQSIQDIKSTNKTPARCILRILGLMAACIDMVPLGRLHMRPIQMYLLSQWRPNIQSIEYQVPVHPTLLQHLSWWMDKRIFFQGTSLNHPNAQMTLITDASQVGWGGHMGMLQVNGQWDATIATKKHINWLELKAVFLSLKHFKKQAQHQVVMLRSDNSTVVSYVNKQGGTRSAGLCMLTWELLKWCQAHQITLKAAHIPGKRNVIADRLSRGLAVKHTEWELTQVVADQIFLVWERPHIDLFATHLNNKLPIYCSPVPDLNAEAIDAFSISWEGLVAYAFPPTIMVPKLLSKVQKENCVIILVAPLWPRQSWFPLLLKLLVALPLKLPLRDDLLSQNRGRDWHPDPTVLNLVAWKLSRSVRLKKDFQNALQKLWHQPDEIALQTRMMQGLSDTTVGVEKDMLIPLQLL